MTRSIRIGATVPGDVPYSSIKMELEQPLGEADNINQVSRNLKLQLARLISGNNPDIYVKALACCNFPSNDDVVTTEKRTLEILEQQIEQCRLLIEEKEKRLDELRTILAEKNIDEVFDIIIEDFDGDREDLETIVGKALDRVYGWEHDADFINFPSEPEPPSTEEVEAF